MSNINKLLFGVKATSKATDQLMSAQTEQTITSLMVTTSRVLISKLSKMERS